MLEAAISSLLLSLPNVDLAEPEKLAVPMAELYRENPRATVLLIAIGYYESRYLDRIQAGQCRRWECDAFVWRGEVRFRSLSYFQLQRSACASREEWLSAKGLSGEAVGAAVGIAGRRVASGLRACGTFEGAASWYAYGSCRGWAGAKKRARLADWVEVKLKSP